MCIVYFHYFDSSVSIFFQAAKLRSNEGHEVLEKVLAVSAPLVQSMQDTAAELYSIVHKKTS